MPIGCKPNFVYSLKMKQKHWIFFGGGDNPIQATCKNIRKLENKVLTLKSKVMNHFLLVNSCTSVIGYFQNDEVQFFAKFREKTLNLSASYAG